MNPSPSAAPQPAVNLILLLKFVIGVLLLMLLLAALLFLPARTMDWWQAWAMMALYLVSILVSRGILILRHPDLAHERAGWTSAQGVKAWDKILMPVVAIYGPAALFLTAGLDKRWGGTPPLPPWLEIAALLGVGLAYAFSAWALLANRFFSAVVRIQRERGHTVMSGGPYRIVRHPGYAGALVGYLLSPLAFGMLWAFVPAVLTAAAVILRTALEDRTLQAELPGYSDYTRQTRFRLLPGIW